MPAVRGSFRFVVREFHIHLLHSQCRVCEEAQKTEPPSRMNENPYVWLSHATASFTAIALEQIKVTHSDCTQNCTVIPKMILSTFPGVNSSYLRRKIVKSTNLHFHSNCLATVSINSGHNGPSFRSSCEVMLSSRLSPVRYNNFRIQTTISRDYVMLFRRVNILCTILNIF